MDLPTLDGLLDASQAKNGPFVGHHVAAGVKRTKYPVVWRPLIERYTELLDFERFATYLYCDMSCTVITKKIMMVDMFYLYDSQKSDDVVNTDNEWKRLRKAHMIMATKYLVKMLTCIYECVRGILPNRVDIMNASTLLYAEIYSEAFDPTAVNERAIFSIVEKWFCDNVLKPEYIASYRNVAPGIPFLFCSHVYWLWLHLTAVRAKRSADDLLTVIYALDTIVYCQECKEHYLQIRSEFFSDSWDNSGEPTCTSCYDNAELLYRLHNRVNVQTETDEIDLAVLGEYETFWKSETLLTPIWPP